MTVILGCVSQKGGTGKCTLARLIAREYAAAKWNVKIADLDIGQGTSFNWQSRRLQQNIQPVIAVERFGTVDQALKVAPHHDMLILDGPPHSTSRSCSLPALLKRLLGSRPDFISRIQSLPSGKESDFSRSMGSTNFAGVFLIATSGV